MTFGSLFAGIGGFDLGFERAGMRGFWQVEIDANCRELLALRFPDAKQYADVREVGAQQLAPVDVITAGFPCQDLSVAGKRAGLKGKRSGLFYEVTRIVSELRPRFVVWENVPGLLTSDKGRDFARVIHALGELGYFGAWRVLDARYLGVAQRRRRVFGVFARSDIGTVRCAEILSLAEGLCGHPPPSFEAGQEVAGTLGACSARGGRRTYDLDGHGAYVSGTLTCASFDGSSPCGGDGRENMLVAGTPLVFLPRTRGDDGRGYARGPNVSTTTAPTLETVKVPCVAFSCKDSGDDAGELSPTLRSMNFAESHLNGGGQVAVADQRGVRRLTPRECERLQGFPDDWTAGFSDSVRYRMLGNAVARPCAEWIGRRIVA